MNMIYIKSFTQAQKAMSFMQKHGIRCTVQRSFGGGTGCGFALKVTDRNASEAEVCALLSSIGVRCDIS